MQYNPYIGINSNLRLFTGNSTENTIDAEEELFNTLLTDDSDRGNVTGVNADTGANDLIGRIKYYQKTKDASVFNSYLPYRNAIQNDPQKLAQYESIVDQVANNTELVTSDESFSPDTSNWSDIDNKEEINDTTKYLVGASIAESFHGRPDLAQQSLNGAKIGFFQIPEESGAAALYSSEDRAIVVDPEEFFVGLTNPNDQYDPLGHEVMHSLEGSDNPQGIADGIFGSMSAEQTSAYVNERERLAIQEQSSPSGIREYAFSQNEEFAAVISAETFFGNPALLKAQSPTMYNIFVSYFNTDPLQYKAA